MTRAVADGEFAEGDRFEFAARMPRERGDCLMPIVSLSANDFEPQHRIPAFQDAAASICKLEIRPFDPFGFQSSTEIAVMPEAVLASTTHSQCTALRTSALAASETDNILIHVPFHAGFSIAQQGGPDVDCGVGTIYVDPNEIPGVARFTKDSAHIFYISIPRYALADAINSADALLRRSVEMTPHWRMLIGYAKNLHQCYSGMSPDEVRFCTHHLHDLARMAFTNGRRVEESNEGRGVRAAGLARLKADIETQLTNPDLSLNALAARHRISPRYARALFAADRSTFRDYVRLRRMTLAHRMLGDLRHGHRTISDIAMSAGFGDLSWFNASYRQIYGMTPSETRAQSIQSAKGDTQQ
ncbi:MAG: helix-turn-helix transcriptional regulator [Allorhizobium sp.]